LEGHTLLFDALIRLSVDETVWDAAGDLDASLRKKGITIPPMDVIIAQVCLHHKVSIYYLLFVPSCLSG